MLQLQQTLDLIVWLSLAALAVLALFSFYFWHKRSKHYDDNVKKHDPWGDPFLEFLEMAMGADRFHNLCSPQKLFHWVRLTGTIVSYLHQ